ncbi:metallophosphoesterase [Streptomyces sp. 3MP-14]|uniref:Metallophosphoesterase n=1 Tax=Streptomyces mimosae TaxID=2586635 RepID=A0A5N5ZUF1_9ACTN|nr:MULTISPECIES: metallophosphoesterase family protein [Streptomyces]KAB8159483.1 metallophosphoesterase [Streptomyces mimosae]KAB8172629.1 metallophosphoesterase [Streptomyces sp. 3MP-14]
MNADARIAVLSDVHGVLPALRAVLDEPAVRDADRIVLTGDLAAGPQPVATLDALAALGERAVWVRGNADRAMAEAGATREAGPGSWAARQLRADQVALLAGLPTTATLELPGLGRVLFCHGTPRSDEEVVLVDSPTAHWARALAGVDPEVSTVVCGNTHMPFVRLVGGRLVVNPGSVGMPYGRPGAHWALLGPGDAVSLRHTAFDVDAACAEIAASGHPDAATWAETYVRSPHTAEEALEVFTALAADQR